MRNVSRNPIRPGPDDVPYFAEEKPVHCASLCVCAPRPMWTLLREFEGLAILHVAKQRKELPGRRERESVCVCVCVCVCVRERERERRLKRLERIWVIRVGMCWRVQEWMSAREMYSEKSLRNSKNLTVHVEEKKSFWEVSKWFFFNEMNVWSSGICVRVCHKGCACARVRACVCVWERERERERESHWETDRCMKFAVSRCFRTDRQRFCTDDYCKVTNFRIISYFRTFEKSAKFTGWKFILAWPYRISM